MSSLAPWLKKIEKSPNTSFACNAKKLCNSFCGVFLLRTSCQYFRNGLAKVKRSDLDALAIFFSGDQFCCYLRRV